MTYAAVPGAVMYTTQSYHALRQEKLPSYEWVDIQILWNMQGNSAYFVGESPKDFERHWKNYLISIDTSLTNWASTKRNNKVKVTNATRRLLQYKERTSMWIASHIATDRDGRLLNVQAIDDAIKAGEQARSRHDPVNTSFGLRQNSVIHRLAAAIEAEIKDITFDYFTLHDLCCDLLEDMKDECRPYIAKTSSGA